MTAILPCAVTLCGLYLLIKLKGFFIFHPIKVGKMAMSLVRDKQTFRSTTLAFAGTLGVGNILGVCVGINLGGAGAIFWLWVSSLLSSVIKYCEVVLCKDEAIRNAKELQGGFSFCIKSTLSQRLAPAFAKGYSFVILLLSLVMGAALQGIAVVDSISFVFNTPRGLIGILLVIFVALGILGGASRIERITSVIIPVSTIIYIIITLSVVFVNLDKLPETLEYIFRDAFSIPSGVGGVVAFLTSDKLREGFCRGILSNEAGAGTSSLAHARSGITNPCIGGVMGMLEVLFDTTLMCTLTGLCALLGGNLAREGLSLILDAVGSLCPVYIPILILLIIAFAYSTVICWYYYGTESCDTVFPRRLRPLFSILFMLFLGFGYLIGNRALVFIADHLLLFASLPVLYTLIKNSDRIKLLSESCGLLNYKRRGFSIKGNGSSTKQDGHTR